MSPKYWSTKIWKLEKSGGGRNSVFKISFLFFTLPLFFLEWVLNDGERKKLENRKKWGWQKIVF